MMKQFCSFVLVLTLVTGSYSKTLLSSDFNADDKGWTQEYGGKWQIRANAFEGKTSSAWAGDKNWTDYQVTLKAKCLEGGDEGQIWLSFRYQDEWNRYAIAIRGGLLDDIALFRYQKTSEPKPSVSFPPSVSCPLIVPLGFDFKTNAWYNIKVEISGPRIKVWIGDVAEPQIDYVDNAPMTKGAIALGGNYHLCSFDDVKIVEIENVIQKDQPLFDKDAIKINFGPSAVKGFNHSNGAAYNETTGFGWDKDYTNAVRLRNSGSEPELDSLFTVAHDMKQATFKMKLPNGKYCVTAVGGDPSNSTHFEVYYQGKNIVQKELNRGEFYFASDPVVIKDKPLEVQLKSKHPDEAGLAIAYLIVEDWDKVAQREAQRVTDTHEAGTQALQEQKEKKRIAQRKNYKAIEISEIPSSGRTEISLNGNWLFMPEQNMPQNTKPYSPQYSDSDWHVIAVPNFWNQIAWWFAGGMEYIAAYKYEEIRRTNDYTFDYGATKTAWYRQWVTIPESAKNRRLILKFDAIASVTTVYVNGARIGDHVGMFAPFEFDITEFVKFGDKNLIAVLVSEGAQKEIANPDEVSGVAVTVSVTNEMLNSLPKGIYTSQSTTADYRTKGLPRPNGIWQPVTLLITKQIVIKDVFFKPDLKGADIEITLNNPEKSDFAGTAKITIAGEHITKDISVAPGKTSLVSVRINAANPKLWTPQTPNLYPLQVDLVKGNKIMDSYSCDVGFRTFAVKDGKYYLNGRPCWLGGGNMPPHGLKPNDAELANKFFKLMHDGNQMITRAVCSPLTPVWAKAADKQGVAISLEGTWPWLALMGKPMPEKILLEAWVNETLDLVKQLRNHPSIVIWTIGNEFFYHPDFHKKGFKSHWQQIQEDRPNDFADPDAAYLRKMKVLDDLVQKIRKLDPTRPVCLWSNYIREKDIYERILKPNGIDDGDITDPHLYLGWYQPSVFQDSQYGGKYLPPYLGQAIMSQEASTGYPNGDNGSPVRHYIPMYVPQAWIGSDAYEHRNPQIFLNYNALITKEWMEDVRRSRKTAGWIAFCNTCWFKYPSFSKHIEPYPAYYEIKKALQPILISLDQRDRHYYQGNKFSGSLVVVNDDLMGRDFSNLKCFVNLKNQENVSVWKEQVPLNDCSYYGKSITQFNFDLPDQITSTKAEFTVELCLKRESEILGTNDYKLLIASKEWAKESLSIQKSISLTTQNKNIIDYLKMDNIGLTNQGDASNDSSLIIADQKAPQYGTSEAVALLKNVFNGGKLVLLETGNAHEFLPPCPKNTNVNDKSMKVFNTNVEFANIEKPDHILFDGLQRQDMRWWNGNGSSPELCKSSYEIDDICHLDVLLEHTQVHSYVWLPFTYPMFIVNHGKGQILVSEIKASSCRTDPLAGRFLRNIIKWLEN